MHTVFSDGKNTAEEMVLKAIELGFKEVGISDHAFTPPYDWSIKKDGQREYIAELKRLKEKYASRIAIFIGNRLSQCMRQGGDLLFPKTPPRQQTFAGV